MKAYCSVLRRIRRSRCTVRRWREGRGWQSGPVRAVARTLSVQRSACWQPVQRQPLAVRRGRVKCGAGRGAGLEHLWCLCQQNHPASGQQGSIPISRLAHATGVLAQKAIPFTPPGRNCTRALPSPPAHAHTHTHTLTPRPAFTLARPAVAACLCRLPQRCRPPSAPLVAPSSCSASSARSHPLRAWLHLAKAAWLPVLQAQRQADLVCPSSRRLARASVTYSKKLRASARTAKQQKPSARLARRLLSSPRVSIPSLLALVRRTFASLGCSIFAQRVSQRAGGWVFSHTLLACTAAAAPRGPWGMRRQNAKGNSVIAHIRTLHL